MTWFFVTPLVIALAVTFIFKNCANEAAYLAGTIVTISLIISLFLAPWQIKALLLIFVILASRRLLESIHPVDDEEKKILTYRGANYEALPPPVEVCDGEIAGKYRGQIWRTPKLKNTTVVTAGMKYRGVPVKSEQAIVPAMEKDMNLE
ncbi:DUF4278 domain-containing protein [Kamptonema animale CS-326]|jgi:predicted membrane protein|uniref:DUF4278 domain-containing protein n=1 Tax=Kamptonema animale TaxID=92934 RepID=UPI00232E6BDF|nr:DUF4278 domain-containing protein [Kamptonema animale]MDB9510747.1 DUF4278 domain-containing protein [Kamptonema animale CS-326]